MVRRDRSRGRVRVGRASATAARPVRRRRRAALVGLVGLALVMATQAAGCAGGEEAAAPGTTVPATTPPTTEPPEAPLEAGKQIYVFVPEVGDCFERRSVPTGSGTSDEIVLLLDCDLPHRQEVFALVDYPVPDGDRSWPGEETILDWAKTACPERFEAYVGVPYELSAAEISYVLPEQSSWPGAHTVACTLVDPANRRVVGTRRDSRQ